MRHARDTYVMRPQDITTERVRAALEANGYSLGPDDAGRETYTGACFIKYLDPYKTKEMHQIWYIDPDEPTGRGTGYVFLKPDDYGTLVGEF